MNWKRSWRSSTVNFVKEKRWKKMKNDRLSVSRWQYSDNVPSRVNCFQALDLFWLKIYVPVAAINDSKLKTPEKHGGLCQPRFDFDKSTARQISLTRGLLPTNYLC